MEWKKEGDDEKSNLGFYPTIVNYTEQLKVKLTFSKGTIVPNGKDFHRF